MNKYKIIWLDYSIDPYGKSRITTIKAKSTDDALKKAYKKFPKLKCPSVFLS